MFKLIYRKVRNYAIIKDKGRGELLSAYRLHIGHIISVSKTSLISSDIFWLLKNARASLHHGHCDFIYKIGLLIYIFVY